MQNYFFLLKIYVLIFFNNKMYSKVKKVTFFTAAKV